jgi:hypothetical protein
MDRIRVMTFASIYPLYVQKVERKGRTQVEIDEVIRWLTGYSEAELKALAGSDKTLEQFFGEATMNPNASKITGVICGYRVEEITEPLHQKVRQMDKLIDELARGKAMEKILRK